MYENTPTYLLTYLLAILFYFSKREANGRRCTRCCLREHVEFQKFLSANNCQSVFAQTSPTGEATGEAAAEPATPEVVEQEREDAVDDPDETESRRQSLKDDVDGQADALTSNSRHSTESQASVQQESAEQQEQSTEDANDVSSSRCRYRVVGVVRKGQQQC